MSNFTHSLANDSGDTPASDVDPRWNHPVTSGDIHKLAREMDRRFGAIERFQRVNSVQLGLNLLGVIALVANRFI